MPLHSKCIFPSAQLAGFFLTSLEAEGVRTKVQGSLVHLSVVQGHTLGTEVLSHGPLGLVYQLLGQTEALV